MRASKPVIERMGDERTETYAAADIFAISAIIFAISAANFAIAAIILAIAAIIFAISTASFTIAAIIFAISTASFAIATVFASAAAKVSNHEKQIRMRVRKHRRKNG